MKTNGLSCSISTLTRGAVILGLALATLSSLPAAVLRGPYLQQGTPTSLIVRWRTDTASLSRVSYGTNAGNLVFTTDATTTTTNHLVALTNLQPDTTYYYAVGGPGQTLAGGSSYFFRTPPPAGSRRPFRVWVLGDSGFTNVVGPLLVRDAYAGFTTNHYTDVWLMLGDNAYHNGADNVWQIAVFNTYSNILRQTPVWSTIGNQETGGAADLLPSRPYLEVFTFPTAGEAGGLPSGTEKYYSFDYANAHFICLDSMSSARTNGSPMLRWLEQDLQQTTCDWVIAFWHHPPYSKGSNDSDNQIPQIEMRTNAVRLLEAYGVDLVLAGHSHSYERSYLLDGHYGNSASFRTNMLKDAGNGRLGGTGTYRKPTLGPAAHEGAVYAVAGSGASLGGGALDHPAMFQSANVLGSMVLDIHANRLEAKFIRETGVITDSFTMIKGSVSPDITGVIFRDGTAALSWNAVAGRTYRVEFSPLLPAVQWADVSGPIRADDITASWLGGGAAGFYRVFSAQD